MWKRLYLQLKHSRAQAVDGNDVIREVDPSKQNKFFDL